MKAYKAGLRSILCGFAALFAAVAVILWFICGDYALMVIYALMSLAMAASCMWGAVNVMRLSQWAGVKTHS